MKAAEYIISVKTLLHISKILTQCNMVEKVIFILCIYLKSDGPG